MTSPDDLDELRARIDDLNARLVAVLHERARLCREIGAHKRRHGQPAIDLVREQAMLHSMLDQPSMGGYPHDQLAEILQVVFSASRRIVEEA